MRLGLHDEATPTLRLLPAWASLIARIFGERTLWLALLFGALVIALAYQSPRSLYLDIGGPFDGPHTPGFHAPESSGQASFRWASPQSSLYFPGLGRPSGPITVRLQFSAPSLPGSGFTNIQTVSVAANGHALPGLALLGNEHSVVIDPAWIGPDGNLRLDFAAPPVRLRAEDRRDLSFIADYARIELPVGLTLPSLSQMGWLLLCGLLLYLLLRAVWLRPVAAALLVGAFFLGCATIIAVHRLFLTVFSGRLAVTLFLALATTLLVEVALRGVTRLAGWRGKQSVPEWAWVGLRALVLAAIVLRVGGLLYPHTVIIDAYFHLKEITYMAEGRPWEQFFGKNLALSVMPKDEWGSARAFIPYSPFFYVVAAPLQKLALPTSLSVPVAMGIFEGSKVALVFLLGLALGRTRHSARVALGAAAVYSFIPVTFLLQQWGNWPTQLSLWLVTLWAALASLFWPRITSPPVWIASTAVLSLALLSYTVTAAYTGIFIGLLVLGGLLFARQARNRWLAIALSLAVASAIALLVFYGQYVDDVIGETLPTFGQAVEEQGKLTTLRPNWGEFLTGTIGKAMQSYNLAIIYALGLAGAAMQLLFRRKSHFSGLGSRVEGRTYNLFTIGLWTLDFRLSTRRVWIAAWLLTFPLFTLLDFYIDQALKEFWYALPAVAIVAAAWLLVFLSKGKATRAYSILAWLLGTALVWQSLSLWLFRLLFHNR